MTGTSTDWALPEHIDADLVQVLIRDELAGLWSDYERPGFSVAQQLRTFALEWLAVFLPQRIGPSGAALIEATAQAIRARDDYRWSGWHRALPLDLALFALTDEQDWLVEARANVDHDNATLREAAMNSLALVADRLEFRDPELQWRVERNLRDHHLCSELGILLLAAAHGEIEEKRDLFSDWLAIDNAFSRETLEGLVAGTSVYNPFSEHLARITQYAVARMAQAQAVRQKDPAHAPVLPTGDVAGMESRLGVWRLMMDLPCPSSLLAASVSAHSLAASSVTLEGFQQEEDGNA